MKLATAHCATLILVLDAQSFTFISCRQRKVNAILNLENAWLDSMDNFRILGRT